MIDLGRYAFAVLASYGIGLALLAGLIWHSVAANARARRALDAHENRRTHG